MLPTTFLKICIVAVVCVHAEEEEAHDLINKGAVLLVEKIVDVNRYISWGQPVPVRYVIHNVGNADAEEVTLEDVWKTEYGRVIAGEAAANWPVIKPGQKTEHSVVYEPRPATEVFEASYEHIVKPIEVTYTCSKDGRSHTVYSTDSARTKLYGAIILQQTYEKLFGNKTEIWLLFGVWAGAMALLPYLVYYKKSQKYEILANKDKSQ